jgi:ribosomal-protein-serine acetyltransferase
MGWLQITDDAHLRLLDRRDARELHELIEANRSELARWLPWAAGQGFEGTLGFIGRTEEQLAANDGFQVAVVCGEELAGVIGFAGVEWQHRSACLGYWLGRQHQGRGTMTAAVRALTGHALSAWELNRVEIHVPAETSAAGRSPSASAFARRGCCARPNWLAAVTSTGSSTRCWRWTGVGSRRGRAAAALDVNDPL